MKECHERILLRPDCLCAAMPSWKESFIQKLILLVQDRHHLLHFKFSTLLKPNCLVLGIWHHTWPLSGLHCWILRQTSRCVFFTSILYSCTGIDKMNGRPSWAWCHGQFRHCWQISCVFYPFRGSLFFWQSCLKKLYEFSYQNLSAVLSLLILRFSSDL